MNTPIRIALVDDDEIHLRGLKSILSIDKEFEIVLLAKHGRDLLEKLQQLDTPPDACLLDLRMPELDGFTVLPMIKKEWPEMKVLAYSMFTEPFNIRRAVSAGADGFYPKGGRSESLFLALKLTIQQGFYFEELPEHLIKAYMNKDIKIPNITEKEVEFLQFCCTELTNKEIAVGMAEALLPGRRPAPIRFL